MPCTSLQPAEYPDQIRAMSLQGITVQPSNRLLGRAKITLGMCNREVAFHSFTNSSLYQQHMGCELQQTDKQY